MTENKKASKMNLIPVLLLVVLILSAGYFLLKGEIKLPNFNDNTSQIRRLNGFPTVIYTSKDIEKQRVVIRSEEELNKFLNNVDPTGILQLQEKINFNKEILIAASTKTNDETGVEMKIKKVFEDKEAKAFQVRLVQSSDGDSCEKDKDKNVAVDLVAISKTSWPITFDVASEIKDCQKSDSKQSTDSL